MDERLALIMKVRVRRRTSLQNARIRRGGVSQGIILAGGERQKFAGATVRDHERFPASPADVEARHSARLR